MSEDRLYKDLAEARELQSKYERGSEMWRWYQTSIESMEREVHAREVDDRHALRSWGGK